MAHNHNHSVRDLLTKEEAANRAALVSNVAYEIRIAIPAVENNLPGNEYQGRTVISFSVKEPAATFVDMTGREVVSLELNGAPLDVSAYKDLRIGLPADRLQAGANRLVVEYRNDFDHTGEGFHKYTDPQDGKVYIHSDFEPFNAHRLFPCFDQPDLKATYQTTVVVPEPMTAVSNARLAAEPSKAEGDEIPKGEAAGGGEVAQGDYTVFRFEKTAEFSTYLFNICAGPYAEFSDEYVRSSDGMTIPLKLYCRASLGSYMQEQQHEIFEVTKQGFDFYQSFFGCDYPFVKYDQLFVPEFNAGAMENVGAVTFAEVFIFRGQVSDDQRLDRADVILHEMAHMWFGNLVTMDWWDGLWLNESFATFMAAWATADATRFGSEAWVEFNARMKRWAYYQDALPTTHPIHTEVGDTEQAFTNFDGISYGKGAAVLKQLAFRIGAENFKAGMQKYFNDYSYGNTGLQDFIDSLSSAGGVDLTEWVQEWLLKPGLNTLRWEGQNGSAVLNQSAPEDHPYLREHKLRIGYWQKSGEGLKRIDEQDVLVKGAQTGIPQGPEADFRFANTDDYAFAKVYPDNASRDFILKNIDGLDDPLIAQILWLTFYEMLRDRDLVLQDFWELILDKLPTVEGISTLSALGRNVPGVLALFTPDDLRPGYRRRLLDTAWQCLEQKTGGIQLNWLRIYIRCLSAEVIADGYFERILELYDGKIQISGVELDQDLRWHLVLKLSGAAHTRYKEILSAESKADPSDRGEREQMRVKAAYPDVQNKSDFWKRFVGDTETSLDLLRAAMGGFRAQRHKVLEPYNERYFTDVRGVFDRTSVQFSQAFIRSLFPITGPEDIVIPKAEDFLGQKDLPEALRRPITEMLSEYRRAAAVRRLAVETNAGQGASK